MEISQRIKQVIREIPDFPKPGINFYDVTPIMRHEGVFQEVIQALLERYSSQHLDAVVGIDARGFVFGAALSYALKLGFIPVRKEGRLPATVERVNYDLEYGSGVLEIHKDAIAPKQRIVVVDDLLATGGTAKATCELLQRLGAEVVECAFVVELEFLRGRERLAPYPLHSLASY